MKIFTYFSKKIKKTHMEKASEHLLLALNHYLKSEKDQDLIIKFPDNHLIGFVGNQSKYNNLKK